MEESKSALSMLHEDEFSLLDLMDFIRSNFLILLVGTLIGGVLGLAIAFVLPAQWEATALLQVGQLGTLGTSIEPPMQVVDRIKNKTFQSDVLTNMGLFKGEDDEVTKDFRKSLKAKLEKSDLISLSLEGGSKEEAKRNLNAVITEIKRVHTRVLMPSIKRLQQELASLEEELKKADSESERLINSLDSKAALVGEKNFSQAVLISSILFGKESQLKNTKERKLIVEEMLSSERTYSTREIGRVEVSNDPVFPKKPLFAATGFFLGLLIAVLLSILKPVLARTCK